LPEPSLVIKKLMGCFTGAAFGCACAIANGAAANPSVIVAMVLFKIEISLPKILSPFFDKL